MKQVLESSSTIQNLFGNWISDTKEIFKVRKKYDLFLYLK